MEETLSPETQNILQRIKKLLDLAAKNTKGGEHEAASAAAKAQELLTQYNLDAALVERAGGTEGKREDAKLRGGFYQYQRDLWTSVAELNFCLYWTQVHWPVMEVYDKDRWTGKWIKVKRPYRQMRHRLVGRVVNTIATKVMAQYLEDTIERIVRDRLGDQPLQKYSTWAVSFREGMVSRVVEKVSERYRERLDAEAMKRAEQAKASHEGRPTDGMGTALALADFVDAESDANMDFLKGEGYSARQKQYRAERARERAEEEARYTRWAAENPDAARAQEERARKAYARRRSSGGSSETKRVDYHAFYAGYDAADKISIDQQVANPKPARLG